MSPESTGLPSPGWACALAPYTFTAGGRGPGGTGESFIGVMGEGALSLESGPGLVPLTPDAIFCLVPRGEAKQMNTMTARALMLGLVIALWGWRSEEHTSELQSRLHLVCRLLLEKKKS